MKKMAFMLVLSSVAAFYLFLSSPVKGAETDDRQAMDILRNMTRTLAGAAASSDYVYSVPCNTTVIVDNVTYYHCDSTWYSRGYEGGEVVYIVTSAPAGY